MASTSGFRVIGSLLTAVSGIALTCPEAFADHEVDGEKPGLFDSLLTLGGDRLHFSGYLNFHVMKHDGAPVLVGKNLNRSLTQLREASLFVDWEIAGPLLFSSEVEFSYDFSDNDASGREHAAELVMNYGYLDYDLGSRIKGFSDEQTLHVRAGKILVPFLAYNERKPNFEQALMSPPFTAMNIVPSVTIPITYSGYGWRDWGAIVNWSIETASGGLFDIKLTAITGIGSSDPVLDGNAVQLDVTSSSMAGMNPTVRPRDGLAQNKDHSLSDNNSDIATSLKISYRLAARPIDIGFSWYRGAWDDDGEHDLVMYGIHFNYIENNWTLKGEWARAKVQQDAGINVVTAMGPAMLNTSTGNYNMSGWYVEGSHVSLRYGNADDKYVRLVARYDEILTNDKVDFTPFDRSRWTVGAEWEFFRNTRLRYEWQTSKLRSFDNAPAAYSIAGGKETVRMNMVSFITFF